MANLKIDGKIVIEDGQVYPYGKRNATDPKRRQSVSHRRAACTHIRLERVYGHLRCPFCQKYPATGWLFQCMQDHDWPAPKEVVLDELKGNKAGFSQGSPQDSNLFAFMQPSTSTLSFQSFETVPESAKTTDNSQYTSAQVEILAAQRAHVGAVIADLCRLVQEQNPKGYHRWVGLPEPPAPTPYTICNWRCCHHCRPTSIERSWISLNTAIASNFTHCSLNDNNGRPLSHLRHVRNLDRPG
jgi:hypothetical protein